MREIEVIQGIQERAEQVLQESGLLNVVAYPNEPRDLLKNFGIPDMVITVRTMSDEEILLVVEVKSYGQPRYATEVVNRFKAVRESSNLEWYGIFGAPYLSPKSIDICRENNVGAVDLAGNCLLKFDGVYIDIQGRRNPNPDRRPIKSIFYTKSTRVIRVLLLNPGREWYVKDLKDEAVVSIGQASNVKTRLQDYELIEEVDLKGRPAFRLKDPKALLKEWSENYSYRKNPRTSYYSFEDVAGIEQQIARYCDKENIRYAFTLTSGANMISPFLRYNRVFAYIDAPTEPIAQALGWSEGGTGWNVRLLRPYDEGILKDLQEVEGKKIVSDLQLYLDLQGYEQRGEEAAEQILKRLEEKW